MNDCRSRRRSQPDHRPVTPTPTSVWPTGTSSLATQLSDRHYHHATGTDMTLMAPTIAEYAITQFTQPGDIVLDPDCGTGTTIVEALRAGRHAIGLTTHRRWHIARANVTAIKAHGAPGDGMILLHRPSTITAAHTAGMTGRVDLLLTTPRPPKNTDTDHTAALTHLGTQLHECRPLMRPGGHVIVTCPPHRHPSRHDLLDLQGQILTLGTAAGLAPIARCLALTADIRGRRIHTHTALTQQRTAARIAHATGHPIALPTHHTVLIFRADPDAADPVLAQPIPPLLLPRRRRTSTPRFAVGGTTRCSPEADNVPVTPERAA